MPREVEWRGQTWLALNLGVCLSEDRRFVREEKSDEEPVYMTTHEATLFSCLADRAPGSADINLIVDAMWGNCKLPDNILKNVHVNMHYLRRKIEKWWHVECIRSFGYRLILPGVQRTGRDGRALLAIVKAQAVA